ncbi:MAG TPA: hypothetical protein VEH83_02740 [Gemmatimonadales bacterium]|nr:hypothetical protein [Gemmatimonadales bacterium]
MRHPLFRIAAVAVALAAARASASRAQDIRVHGTTTTQYVQLRPIAYDSTANSDTGGFVALPATYAAPFTQDLEVSAWGLGVEGLRAYALVRGRAALGSGLIWPQSDEHFQTMYAYLELERPSYLLRGGRQQRASGLGWYAFDGLTALWRPLAALRIEGYGGRGLARASLDAPNSSAITSLDPLQPDQGTILLGASLWAAPSPRSTFSAIYQRELLADRSGLVSERAALDGRVGVGSQLVLAASADADLAREQWGKARISATVMLGGGASVQVEAFQYRPTLDLSTIWGVFAPESHAGYSATLNLAPARDLTLTGAFTYRHWQPLSVGSPFLVNVGNDQKEATAGVHLRRGAYTVEGDYHLELGFGGDQSAGDVRVAWSPTGGWHAGVQTTAFQQTDMFRVAGSTVYGLGADFGTALDRRVGLKLDVTRYFQRRQTGSTGVDWNQTRASVTFDWTIGADADRVGSYR